VIGRGLVIALLLIAAGCAGMGTGEPVAKADRHTDGQGNGSGVGVETRRLSDDPIDKAIVRGVDFLIKTQNPDGSWGTGLETRGFEVYSMVPGSHDAFRVATTALCVMATREAGAKDAHARGLEYLIQHGEARRDAGPLLYNVWAHTYATQALAEELKLRPDDERVRKAAQWQIERLVRYEAYTGGWNYYDFDAQTRQPSMGATSFGTAAGLVALHTAREAGLDVPQPLIDRALRRLEEMRLPDGAYLYSHDMKYMPRHEANRIRGSIGRTQAGNAGLWTWKSGKVDEAKVRKDLQNFFDEHQYIDMGRKRQFPHESWYMTAPYYYYFGHYYAARLLEMLGPSGREQFGAQLAEHIVPKQDSDGSWWDYAMWDYHKPYGTAFSVMTLLRCRPYNRDESAGHRLTLGD